MRSVAIIGSGFSSLAAASYLAQAGYEVNVYEKNAQLGGRARQYIKDGFTFDMGPTWYWMPDVFERFFEDFGHSPSDFYKLQRLSPAYQVYFDRLTSFNISADLEENIQMFERIEKGSGQQLEQFLQMAETNYKVAITDLVYKPGLSPLELISTKTIGLLNQVVSTIQKQIRSRIKDQRLIKILEFPVLFLGAKPSNTPALYNFMNWADLGLGTWHPKGGMYEVAQAMIDLAKAQGAKFHTMANVKQIVTQQGIVTGIDVNGQVVPADVVLSGADYHHSESLLDNKERQYSEKYWDKRTFAPSALLFYVAFDGKLKNVNHHTLFFDSDFEVHAADIYDQPAWPEKPLFYASFPSMTDDAMAPEGKEAATFLIPLAPGLEDTEALREKYFDHILQRLEHLTDQKLSAKVLFKRSYCVNDFIEDYNSYKGNAYGLANTLTQTAFLRPRIRSKKVKGLYFSGQLTVPGPGVPPALISGKIVSELINKDYPIHEKHI